MGHAAAGWECGEIGEVEIIRDGGEYSYFDSRLELTEEEETVTAESNSIDAIISLGGLAAERRFDDGLLPYDVSEHCSQDLDHAGELLGTDSWTVDDSAEYRKAEEIISKYRPQILSGARQLAKQGSLSDIEIKAIFLRNRKSKWQGVGNILTSDMHDFDKEQEAF